ncbi:hypothetical protein [Rugamonas sp.]|nr:hypothetical protein [Rugamonas sp.]
MNTDWIKEQFKDPDHANFSISVICGVGGLLSFCIGMLGYYLSK